MKTPRDWVTRPLSQFVSLQRGFDLPTHARVPGSVPVLSSGGVNGSHNEAKVDGDNFVIGRATNIGRPTWSSVPFWPLNTTLFVKDFLGNFPKFCFYWFLATDLSGFDSGSVQPMLNRNYIANIPVAIPSFVEQRRIAGVLGALDDKIESNRQICSLINLLSEELFCSRFRLRKDCTTKGILTIGDLGEIVGGGTPSKKVEEYYVDSGIAWLTPKDLARDSSTFRHHGAIDISELGLRKSSARLLPRGTVLFTSRAPIGYIAIASGETSTNQGFKSIVPHPEFGTAFTFYLLKQLTPEIVSSANGSTFKEISKGGLASISFDAPDRASVREFNSLVQPLLDLQEAKESETCRLSKLRDALLPELMSGRMRVDKAGRLVSEALDKEVADV